MICRTRSGSALAITGRSGVRSSRREPRGRRAGRTRAPPRGPATPRSTLAAFIAIAAGVELGEVEQIGGQLGQADDLLAHRAHELGPLLGARVLLLEQLDEAAEAEDRRAQLVRGVGDELLAGAVELGEAPLHLVEGAGELAELAGGGDRDRRLEVAVGDFAGGVLRGGGCCARRAWRSRCRAPVAISSGDQAADEDLPFDRAEAAGGAADRDRVDVDRRATVPTAIADRDQGDPAAEVGGPAAAASVPTRGSGSRRRAR